jgi:transcriptional regulator with XRE-family HTH domain
MIHIARNLSEKRKEKGITQEELASFMGVSKASVSKWETGQSYPDISILPQLASYYNISIDELMGYEPQMDKEEIRRLYARMAEAFGTRPFDAVLEECRDMIRKYYSCFPFLLNMANLLMNHFELAVSSEVREEILKEVIQLCRRVKEGSRDILLNRQANLLEAMGYLELGKPKEALKQLGDTVSPILGEEIILATAFELAGEPQKAIETLQIDIYQKVIGLISDGQKYLLLHIHQEDIFHETVLRMSAIGECFQLNRLHPMAMGNFYYTAAMGYLRQNKREDALAMMEKFAGVWLDCDFPVKLHGDAYFSQVENWFQSFDLKEQPPLDESIIKKNLMDALSPQSHVGQLAGEPRYELLVKRMKNKLNKCVGEEE